MIGAAPNVDRLASIDVCNSAGWCDAAWIIAGLDWAIGIGRPRHIVNISLGLCVFSTALHQAVNRAVSANILIVASAGNQRWNENTCPEGPAAQLGPTDVMFPARFPATLAVTGTLEDDSFAAAPIYYPPPGGGGGGGGECGESFCPVQGSTCIGGSRYGSEADISAPFTAISMWGSGQYSFGCGTSQAAALVSGVAALVWSRYPSLTAAQVRQHLMYTAVPVGPATYFGAGRVDAARAMQPPVPPIEIGISGPSHIVPGATCTWDAIVTSGSGPFTYSWTNDASYVGASQSYTGGRLSGSTGASFILRVEAVGQAGSSGIAELVVQEQAGSPPCDM